MSGIWTRQHHESLELRVVPFGAVLDIRTTTSQNSEARFRGGRVFKSHRLVYHSTLGSTVINEKKKIQDSHVRNPDTAELFSR